MAFQIIVVCDGTTFQCVVSSVVTCSQGAYEWFLGDCSVMVATKIHRSHGNYWCVPLATVFPVKSYQEYTHDLGCVFCMCQCLCALITQWRHSTVYIISGRL